MAQSDASLAKVERMMLKSFELSRDSNDALLALFTKSFETTTIVLSQASNDEHIMRCMEILDHERTLALQMESKDVNAVRCLSFELVKCLQITLLKLRGKKNFEQSQELTSHGQVEILPPPPALSVMDEPQDDFMQDCQIPAVNKSMWINPSLLVDSKTQSVEVVVHYGVEKNLMIDDGGKAMEGKDKWEELFGGVLVENKKEVMPAAKHLFSCSECSKGFPSLRGLQSHAYKHTQNMIRCLCNQWVRKENLAKHAKLCHATSPPNLELMDGPEYEEAEPNGAEPEEPEPEKPAPAVIKRSVPKKMGKGKLSCVICGRKLHDKSHLDYHMRQHTGETPFPCPYCDHSFRAVSLRNAHIRRMHDGGSYRCNMCCEEFKNQPELQQHLEQNPRHLERLL